MPNLIEYMRQRQAATDRRRAGQPPWSEDPVIAKHRLCSVIRDDDRTSVEAWGDILSLPRGDRLRAVLPFRLTNSVTSLRAITESGARITKEIRAALDTVPRDERFNYQAYRIMVPGGWWNLDGVAGYTWKLWQDAEAIASQRTARGTVERIHYAGPGLFLAYQTMQDLRWVRGPYPDEDEWCYLGPGAMRGPARLDDTYVAMSSADRRRLSQGMKDAFLPAHLKARLVLILTEARTAIPRVNMFEVEHSLCEWDKYRIASGETRGVPFKPRQPEPSPEAEAA